MSKTNFETLQVYKMAEFFSDEIWKIVAGWEYFAKDTVGKQIVRSVDSIGANIAEGTGKGSREDNRRFVRHARGSLYETKYWLARAYSRKLLSHEEFLHLETLSANLTRTLNGYMRYLNNPNDSKLKS